MRRDATHKTEEMTLRQIGGESPAIDPPTDDFAVWEYIVDSETTDAQLPKDVIHNTQADQ